ncbi:MAG: low molecular weight phosphatase family protein [Vicinamibacteria bacterium]
MNGARLEKRVLFVCTGNTCRSVIAEYIARDTFGNAVTFESAGIKPQPAADAENAVYGYDLELNSDSLETGSGEGQSCGRIRPMKLTVAVGVRSLSAER